MTADILNTPIRVANEDNTFVSLQLARVVIENAQGEAEVEPEVVLFCGQRGKKITINFNVEQVNELINTLNALKKAYFDYNKARLSK